MAMASLTWPRARARSPVRSHARASAKWAQSSEGLMSTTFANSRRARAIRPVMNSALPSAERIEPLSGSINLAMESIITAWWGWPSSRNRTPLENVTTPPYDTVSPEEHDRYLQASPHNVIRLDLGEDRPGDDGTSNKYRRASEQLREWRAQGILVPTPRPACFPYEIRCILHGRHRRIRGVIGAVELEDWGGSIVPHERTAQGPVEDRLRLMREIRANLSCIHAVFFDPSPPLATLLERVGRTEPLAEALDEEGVTHRLWMADAEES